jgi:phosphoribosylaminoimidazolecarboxamide formyltransferase/IMP cyclohydrolase
VAVSETVDASLARIIAREVSDGIIAPAYEPGALAVLKAKVRGSYRVFQIDPSYEPLEYRDAFGLRLEEERNAARITPELFRNVVTTRQDIPADVLETLLVATITLKYTQSNNVCIAYDGQVIGNGAGQQSRVHCVRLACSKAEKWLLLQHPRVLGLEFKEGLMRAEKTNLVDQFLLYDELSDAELEQLRAGLAEEPEPLSAAERREWIGRFDGICLSSDAFFPFRDSIDRASRTNVQYIAQPGGSLRDEPVIEAANSYDMVMAMTGLRLFTH